MDLQRFLDKVERNQTWFRAAMDLPAVLDNWGAELPPERVHFVTVPHDRGPPGNELWLRFCRAFGIDPAWAPLDSERTTGSLGIAETAARAPPQPSPRVPMWRDATCDALIRELLAQDVWRRATRSRPAPAWIASTSPKPSPRCGSTGSSAPASTWSVTRGTCARRRPDPDTRWRDPDGSAPSCSSVPRSTR